MVTVEYVTARRAEIIRVTCNYTARPSRIAAARVIEWCEWHASPLAEGDGMEGWIDVRHEEMEEAQSE